MTTNISASVAGRASIAMQQAFVPSVEIILCLNVSAERRGQADMIGDEPRSNEDEAKCRDLADRLDGLEWRYYTMDEQGNVHGTNDVHMWGRAFENYNRAIDKTQVTLDVRVSTVFLGIDHRFGDGPPMLFETMIFGGPLDQEQARYSTIEEVCAGHAAMVERVKSTK